jgi:hypothetical protein
VLLSVCISEMSLDFNPLHNTTRAYFDFHLPTIGNSNVKRRQYIRREHGLDAHLTFYNKISHNLLIDLMFYNICE